MAYNQIITTKNSSKKKKKKKTELTSNYTFNTFDTTTTAATTICSTDNITIRNIGSNYTTSTLEIIDPGIEKQDEIIKHLKLLEERLIILQDNVEKHEKYPTLKNLYDQYKMVEALIGEDVKNENNKKNKN